LELITRHAVSTCGGSHTRADTMARMARAEGSTTTPSDSYGLELSKPRGARTRLLDESPHHYENVTKERNVRRDVGDR